MANSIVRLKRLIKIQHHLTQSLAPHTPLVLLGLTGDEGLSCERYAERLDGFAWHGSMDVYITIGFFGTESLTTKTPKTTEIPCANYFCLGDIT